MNDIKDARVLVTGGSGFVGSYVVDQLLDEDAKEVVIVDNFVRSSCQNLEKASQTGKIRVVETDIRNGASLDEIFKGIDYCFHMAALRITRCAEHPREAVEVMMNGTYNVIESCLRHGVKKLVAASSASIYGNADTFPTKENHHPYNNRTLYGALKAANELMYRAFNQMQGLNYVAMRYFNIYGPRMDAHGKHIEVLIHWYNAIREGRAPQIYGNGKQTMDFIHVRDVANANILALKLGVVDEVLNIASSQEVSLSELCELLLQEMGSPLEPQFVAIPEQRKKVEVVRRLADVSKAKELIGFEAKISLREGLRDLIQWLDIEGKR